MYTLDEVELPIGNRWLLQYALILNRMLTEGVPPKQIVSRLLRDGVSVTVEEVQSLIEDAANNS